MALLTKLQDDPDQHGVTLWQLFIAQEELDQLSSGRTIGFNVALPKDTPIVDTLAKVSIRRMPAELADRHRISVELDGDPALIASKVREVSEDRLEELVAIVGTDLADKVIKAAKDKGSKK